MKWDSNRINHYKMDEKSLGVHELRREIMSEYIMNMETQKLELHFEKADYMALSEELKKEIKSNFLFSCKAMHG